MINTAFVQERKGVGGGYPCVGDTRIPVRSLVLAYRQVGRIGALEEIFPDLTPEQIRYALDWYEEHRARVDEDIERNERALRVLGSPPLLSRGRGWVGARYDGTR